MWSRFHCLSDRYYIILSEASLNSKELCNRRALLVYMGFTRSDFNSDNSNGIQDSATSR